MPVLFAHMNPQSSCATLVRTRGVDGSRGFGQGAVEFRGGEVISTVGLRSAAGQNLPIGLTIRPVTTARNVRVVADIHSTDKAR